MKPASKEQIKKIHVLLNQQQLMPYKAELIQQFSHGRTESSKELALQEASELIKALSRYDRCDPMRRKIFALAYEAGIIWGDSLEDKKINGIKLNQFLLTKGSVKKELHRMSYEELIKAVTQLEQVVKHKTAAAAAKLTTGLLNELGIQAPGRRNLKTI